jgi:hypothetical protein
MFGRHAFPIPLPIQDGLRIAASCALMAAAIMRLPDSGWTGLVLRVGVGSGIYIIAAIVFDVAAVRKRLLDLMRRGIVRDYKASGVVDGVSDGNKGV